MRQVFILNCALLALSSVMALVLGVVCLIYAVYMGERPELRDEFPYLVVSALLFMGLASLLAAATWTLRRALRAGRMDAPALAGQAVAVLGVTGLVLFYLP